jgi:hypothetical protein
MQPTPDTETRVWGPPGCGKTSYLSRQTAHAAEKFGRGAVLVRSLTTAAAYELAGRGLPIEEDHLGTLHSLCYRILGRPRIAETQIKEWNRLNPGLRLSPRSTDIDAGLDESDLPTSTIADGLLTQMNILRARLVPPDRWPASVQRFAASWNTWKRHSRMMDFTDLLENARRDFRGHPSHPDVIVGDEAQDFTRLALDLLRQWGRTAEHLIFAMDDDQTLFGFAGADPLALLEDGYKIRFEHVLRQSYRLPRRVYALAEHWVHQLSRRQEKHYQPRDAEGEVRVLHSGAWCYPDPVLNDAERYLSQGKTVMFLVTCRYMLERLLHALRDRGWPFFNPYRLKSLPWNPLTSLAATDVYAPNDRRFTVLEKHGIFPADRLLDFLHRLDAPGQNVFSVNAGQSTGWPRPITTGGQLRLMLALEEEDPAAAIGWWLDHLVPRCRKLGAYPARVAIKAGLEALTLRPAIIVGTGHSVKGGEADVVYVFPDLSATGERRGFGIFFSRIATGRQKSPHRLLCTLRRAGLRAPKRRLPHPHLAHFSSNRRRLNSAGPIVALGVCEQGK